MTASFFKKLNGRYKTPRQVQQYLNNLKYNDEAYGETQRSAFCAVRAKKVHCLEASLVAAAILEHSGYPPLVLSLESIDNLDHVAFIFKEKTGWGAISRSRMIGLQGRRPVFRTLRDLAWSYFDPFVDDTGRVTAYGVANLDVMDSPWRESPKNVWKVVNHLIDLKHKKFRNTEKRYQKWYKHFLSTGTSGVRQKYWW